MPNPFSAPSSSTGIDWKDANGALLLIEPLSTESDIQTVHGPSNAVRANVVVLDDGGKLEAGATFADALVFPRVLQSQLKPSIGGKVLGRLGQGQAKKGQSAPWVLADPTEDDVKVGLAYLEKHTAPAPF